MSARAEIDPRHDAASGPASGRPPQPRFAKVIAAATVGNVLEWYDWGVFAFLVTHIAKNFFPSQDPTAALLSTFATFGAGFVARPVGALVIGWIGDRFGRKAALLTTIYIMAIGTVGTAFIPGFDTVGLWGPVLLVVARLLQGISTGGELGGSLAFIVEWAPDHRRGFYGSFQQASTTVGILLGSGIAALLNSFLTADQMTEWGWRIPFLLGGLLVPVGIWMRRDLHETPVYLAAKAREAAAPGFRDSLIMVLRAVGFGIGWTTCQYLILTYMATFTLRYGGLTERQSLWSHTIGLLFAIVSAPTMGFVSDRLGRRPLLLLVNVFFVATCYFVFRFVSSQPGFAEIVAVQCLLGIMMGIHTGVGASAITEIFPTRSRSFLNSLAFALVVTVFGGFSPYVATWLIRETGSPIAPAMQIMATGLVSIVAVALSRETARKPLA